MIWIIVCIGLVSVMVCIAVYGYVDYMSDTHLCDMYNGLRDMMEVLKERVKILEDEVKRMER